MSFGFASQTLGLWYDCPSVSEATLKHINMIGLYLIAERQYDSTKSNMGALIFEIIVDNHFLQQPIGMHHNAVRDKDKLRFGDTEK